MKLMPTHKVLGQFKRNAQCIIMLIENVGARVKLRSRKIDQKQASLGAAPSFTSQMATSTTCLGSGLPCVDELLSSSVSAGP